MIIRKILKEEFIKLKDLFPGDEELWLKYSKKRLEQFDNKEIDVYVIEDNSEFIGELTVNYISHDLESETIPNIRAYFEAFRIDKRYQGKRLGQKLISPFSSFSNNGNNSFSAKSIICGNIFSYPFFIELLKESPSGSITPTI